MNAREQLLLPFWLKYSKRSWRAPSPTAPAEAGPDQADTDSAINAEAMSTSAAIM
jgi:hypothetical protein